MSRRRKGLSPEDQDLWQRVARTAMPLRRPPAPHAVEHNAKPAPQPADALRASDLFPAPPARKAETRIILQPTIEETVAAHPLRMDHGTFRKLKRGKTQPEARIDLHGMTLAEAHPALIGFILRAQASGFRLVLVITGKGKARTDDGPIPQRIGALRHQVPHWLHAPPLGAAVQQIAAAHPRHGGAGAYYVYLRRLR